jgi:hypothetical protein
MNIDRRTLIKNMLILAPAGYVGVPHLLLPAKSIHIGKGENQVITYYIYPHLLNPREYPDDKRRLVQPPDWEVFNNKTNFITLRSFQIENNQIVHYSEDMDIYTKTYYLGNIIWPNHEFLSAENIPALISEFKKRNLFLFDIWGYVPGSGPGTWMQFKLSPGICQTFNAQLGDHWLGMDNGEQDGRYIGGYASQMYPSSADRKYQYLNFQQHFQKLTDDLGNKMSTLVSLSFGHYFLKQGLYTMIGAETAQALPNTQIFYSFIRGAGKQYGVPWFGNTSVYNRWGHKSYDAEGEDYGPGKGTSLSLMRRLMYSHILYNAVAVGFEAGWFYADRIKHLSGSTPDESALTPIGHVQQNAVKWIQKNGQPGVMYTPVALMLDFFAGWTFPRHLYSDDPYRVWGNLPYQPGDYLTDNVLDLIYPGYQNSSYYHDETGFICPTPYGDIADCILSDAESWILAQYPVLVIAGEISGSAELHDKLQNYVKKGGHLIITSGNLLKFSEGLSSVKVNSQQDHFKKGKIVNVGKEKLTEETSFDFYKLSFPDHADILATAGNTPMAIQVQDGGGKITVFSSTFGASSRNVVPPNVIIKSEDDKPLLKPFPILNHVKSLLNRIFNSLKLFEVNEALGLITCCKREGVYQLGITNNTWTEKPVNIKSHFGDIIFIKEQEIDRTGNSAVGYLPENLHGEHIGNSAENTIAGGDIRIFEVKVQELNVTEVPQQEPPVRPQSRYLVLRDIQKVKNEILTRPTFFQHFNGIAVDWKYLHTKESNILRQEAGWISRQKLKIIVDLTSGVDFYPELRLIDNLHEDYVSSMVKIEDVITKMKIFYASELILPLHRFPENSFTKKQTWDSFTATFIRLCKYAKLYDVNLNLRLTLGRPPYTLKEAADFIEKVDLSNVRLAPETAFILAAKGDVQENLGLIKGKLGLWLLSGLKNDLEGKYWDQNIPISVYKDKDSVMKIIRSIHQIPVVLDGVYKDHDEEYLDAYTLDTY